MRDTNTVVPQRTSEEISPKVLDFAGCIPITLGNSNTDHDNI
tara:strand:- start:267 stop:392 length:126 start_codon:yes stop_codon:yes gene_type:complete